MKLEHEGMDIGHGASPYKDPVWGSFREKSHKFDVIHEEHENPKMEFMKGG